MKVKAFILFSYLSIGQLPFEASKILRMKSYLLYLILLISIGSKAQNCNKLPQAFSSYAQAMLLVKSSTFQIKESANTSGSSWMTSAKYYSCDGYSGYFIYTTNRGYEYIHKGVPINVWRGLKNASSKGSYYDDYLKGNYQLPLE